jgi:hypothetical protein
MFSVRTEHPTPNKKNLEENVTTKSEEKEKLEERKKRKRMLF